MEREQPGHEGARPRTTRDAREEHEAFIPKSSTSSWCDIQERGTQYPVGVSVNAHRTLDAVRPDVT
jgi:hypothetical protein